MSQNSWNFGRVSFADYFRRILHRRTGKNGEKTGVPSLLWLLAGMPVSIGWPSEDLSFSIKFHTHRPAVLSGLRVISRPTFWTILGFRFSPEGWFLYDQSSPWKDYMTAFLKAMGQHIGSTVCELQALLLPCMGIKAENDPDVQNLAAFRYLQIYSSFHSRVSKHGWPACSCHGGLKSMRHSCWCKHTHKSQIP